jgi:hypothetical protein
MNPSIHPNGCKHAHDIQMTFKCSWTNTQDWGRFTLESGCRKTRGFITPMMDLNFGLNIESTIKDQLQEEYFIK